MPFGVCTQKWRIDSFGLSFFIVPEVTLLLFEEPPNAAIAHGVNISMFTKIRIMNLVPIHMKYNLAPDSI